VKLLVQISDPARADQINSAAGANLKNVVRWSSPVVVTSNGAGATITVQHDLGTVPNRLAVEPWVDGRWWADQDDRRVWTSASVTFHVSPATGRFTVFVGVQ
jgi:hypothetical protein